MYRALRPEPNPPCPSVPEFATLGLQQQQPITKVQTIESATMMLYSRSTGARHVLAYPPLLCYIGFLLWVTWYRRCPPIGPPPVT